MNSAPPPDPDEEIPDRWVRLCLLWHGGQSTMLYAAGSRGAVRLGGPRPPGCDTDGEWLLLLWRGLLSEVLEMEGCAEREQDGDLAEIRRFLSWVSGVVSGLEAACELAGNRAA